MANIELVIKIPEKLACEGFERLFTEEEKNILIKAIGNGTPLPKGHKRLIEEKVSLSGIHFKTELDHAMMIGRLNSAPTIIEADKAESEAYK